MTDTDTATTPTTPVEDICTILDRIADDHALSPYRNDSPYSDWCTEGDWAPAPFVQADDEFVREAHAHHVSKAQAEVLFAEYIQPLLAERDHYKDLAARRGAIADEAD